MTPLKVVYDAHFIRWSLDVKVTQARGSPFFVRVYFNFGVRFDV